MNNKGFTLVEVLVVIVLLGSLIGLGLQNVLKSSEKAKQRMLLTKIENIEKAAVLYGQDNRDEINVLIDDTSQNKIDYPLCYKEQADGSKKFISNCYYYDGTITVKDLATSTGESSESYLKYDVDDENISGDEEVVNPINKNSMNQCEIQIYQKYGKIYADYIEDGDSNYKENCWK